MLLLKRTWKVFQISNKREIVNVKGGFFQNLNFHYLLFFFNSVILGGYRNISNVLTITTKIDRKSEGLVEYAKSNGLWNGSVSILQCWQLLFKISTVTKKCKLFYKSTFSHKSQAYFEKQKSRNNFRYKILCLNKPKN